MPVFCGSNKYAIYTAMMYNSVQYKPDYLLITVKNNKTDVYRKGSEIVIVKSTSFACPYSILSRYMSETNLTVQSDDFLFKPAFRS
jgi:hypothetical protein